MMQLDWETGIGLHFSDEAEYYQTLGFLSKNPDLVVVQTHDNDRSGAWAGQGKLHTHVSKRLLPPALYRAFMLSGDDRLSVTEYVRNLVENHGFTRFHDPTGNLYTFYRYPDSVLDVKDTVPSEYEEAFNRGYYW